MTCWSNWLQRLVLFYGILLGFTTIYVDVKKRIVKSYTTVKIFVFLKNILYFVIIVYYLNQTIALRTFGKTDLIISFGTLLIHFFNLLLCVVFISLRIKGDKALKKWLQLLMSLESNYFDKWNTKVDKKLKIYLTLNYIVMTVDSILSLYVAFPFLLKEKFQFFLSVYIQNYFFDVQHYIMLHHCLLLFLINNNFYRLNYKLQNNEVKSPIASIYMQLLKLRQEINSLYGPAIFIIFSSLILMYSISAYTLCTLWLEYHFAIQTTKETTNIMLEDCTIQQNREFLTVIMTYWSNWLLRLVLGYGILLGFTTIYVDIKKRLVKSNIIIGSSLLFIHFFNMMLCVMFILWRIKGDKALKEWLQLLMSLETNYFDKWNTKVDKKLKIYLTLHYIVMTVDSILSLYTVFPILLEKDIQFFLCVYIQNYFFDMEHYIMLHHCLLLILINDKFSCLNYQLQYGEDKSFIVSIYIKLLKLRQEINSLYGPAILTIFSSLILMYAQTTKETTNILMEDCTTQQNREQIEYLCLVRSVLPLNIEICGIIDIDFKYFFGIIVSSVLYIIVFTQSSVEHWAFLG
ncbi:hypothetical protein CVS40_5553 [Lucilia cuprina]|nr:hypothetical protein CVS40_5553 [Lucilia cuprina]